MGDVVNLRLARKRAARAADDEQAARNRAAHGRPKAERELERKRAEREADVHEAHRRDIGEEK